MTDMTIVKQSDVYNEIIGSDDKSTICLIKAIINSCYTIIN